MIIFVRLGFICLSTLVVVGCCGVQFGETKVPYSIACGTDSQQKCLPPTPSKVPPFAMVQQKATITRIGQAPVWHEYLGRVAERSDESSLFTHPCGTNPWFDDAKVRDDPGYQFTFEIKSKDLVSAGLDVALAQAATSDTELSAEAATAATQNTKNVNAAVHAALEASGQESVSVSGTYHIVQLPQAWLDALDDAEGAAAIDGAPGVHKCQKYLDTHPEMRLVLGISVFEIEKYTISNEQKLETTIRTELQARIPSWDSALAGKIAASIVRATKASGSSKPRTVVYGVAFNRPKS